MHKLNTEEVIQKVLTPAVQYPNAAFELHQGLGMTSQRTRDRLIKRLITQGIDHLEVLEVMRRTPRHLFLDEALASRSYEDVSLPIGFGQTISQPWVVAKMTAFLLEGEKRPQTVLEIGTGSGYQTAILAQLVNRVYSVERIEPLSTIAQERLAKLQLDNIAFAISDGHWGWPKARGMQFDAILSAAAPETVPEGLFEQLKVGGRLVIPVGGQSQAQRLMGFEKQRSGIKESFLGEVLFVPMQQGVVQ